MSNNRARIPQGEMDIPNAPSKLRAIYQIVQDARYALVDGNLSKEPVAPSAIEYYLEAIRNTIFS